MIRRVLSRNEVEENPHCVWNAFVDLLACESYDDLAPEQRAAHLVFWYESEVQNGGHLQYFENTGTQHLSETIESLGMLGADYFQRLLSDAGEVWKSRDRTPIESVEEYCDEALEDEFNSLDERFYKCNPPLTEVLERHLQQRQSLFVVVK